MPILSRIAFCVLCIFAAIGIVCGLAWCAVAIGLMQPLIVVSGSMEPEISTGDLLIDTKVDTAALRPGDVATLRSDLTHDLVTHRIESIEQLGGGRYRISMKGDANEASDPLDYFAGATAWRPIAQLDGWGAVLQRVTSPAVAVPLVVGLLGLLGLAAMPPTHGGASARRPEARRSRGTG